MGVLESGAQYQRVSGTAAGTTVVYPLPGVLYRVVLGQGKTGTVSLYDSDSAVENLIAAVDNNSGTVPTFVDFGCRVKNGIVAVVSGTTDVTVIYN
jgi:hypothetical protein